MIYARARAKRETNDERSHQFRIYQKGLVENVWRVCRWRCVFYSPEIRVLPFLPLWDEPVPRGCPRHCSDEFEKTWQKKMLIVNMKIATGVFTHQVSFFTRTTSFSLSLLRDLRFSSSYFSPSLSLSLFFFASLNIRSVEGVMTS